MSTQVGSTRRRSTQPRSVAAPISTLLLTGLACCVCSSAHRGEKEHEHVILLAVAYWAWRLGEDLFRSKRKRSKVAAARPSKLTVLSLGGQAAVLSLCLHHAGPLRTALLLILCHDLPFKAPSADLLPLLPSIVAAFLVLAQQSYDGLLSVLPLLALCATTILDRFLQISSARVPGAGPSRRSMIIQSAGSSALVLVGLWLGTAVCLPNLDDLAKPSSLFSLLLACLLARYLPLDRISSSGSVKAALGQSREGAIVVGTIVTTQLFALPPTPSRLDLFMVLPLYTLSIYLKSRTSAVPNAGPSWSYIPTQIATTTRYSIMSILPASWKPHFQTILLTPTSSKIFYFLLLNLAYMAVQMAYGVITNSLGLISDAIHMLFDCLGLAVGLWASVAATWKPDGRYTYGYSRVETLSGFANGCFLILISVFIIFEAAQRIIDPPEVSTHQLLLVSTIGLLINLWGMYATGGHHHHGHSHGHSHEHSHVPVNEKKVDHRHPNGHAHAHVQNLTKKSSAHDLRPSLAPGNAHRRVSATVIHDHDHSHPDGEPCDHDHDHNSHQDHSTHDHEGHGGHDHHEHTTHDHDHNAHTSHDHDDHDHHGHHHDEAHSHHGHEHHHHGHSSHGHAHSHNMRGVFLHVLADTLGSVGVIVSTILIRLTGWTVFDPLASLFIAALIMASVIPLVIDSAKVLCLDVGAETEVQVRAALSELASVEGLSNYSAPRFWPTCEGEVNGSIHIQLAPIPGDLSKGPSYTPRLTRPGDAIYYNADKVVGRIEKVLRGRISGLTEMVIQVEGSDERSYCSCMTGGG